MNSQTHPKCGMWRSGFVLAALCLTSVIAAAGQTGRSALVITSTNNASGNAVVVFKLDTAGTPSLALAETCAHGRQGRREHKRRNSAVRGRSGSGGELWIEHRQPIGAVRQLHCYWEDDPTGVRLRESGFGCIDPGTSLRSRRQLCRESCVALGLCRWARREPLRSFGGADRSRQELGSRDDEFRISTSVAAHT